MPTPGTPPTAGTPQIGRTGQTPVVTNGTGPRADAYHTDRVPRPGELPRTVAAPPPGTGPVAVPAGDLPASTGAGPAPGAGTFDGGPVTSPVPSGADPSPGEPVHPAPRPSPPIRALRGDTGPMPVTSEWFAPPSDSGAPQDTVPATPQPPPDDDATPHPPVAGSPAVPSPDEDAWAQDWASGAWAGAVLTPEPEAAQAGPQAPVANPDGADADAPTPPPGVPIVHAPAPPQDTTTGGRRPRHLLLDEDPAPHATGTGGTPDAAAETPQPQAPAPGGPTASPRPQPRPGPAPGSVADRLSTTEQQLLARLHEELEARESGGEPTPRNGTARRPRPGPA